MSTAASATRAASQTSSLTKIVYVTRKVQADFLAIMDTYGYFNEAYAQKLIGDVRTFLDEDAVEYVKFLWKKPGTNTVLDEIRYRVVSGGLGLADDRPGGVTYNPALRDADFTVRVTYSDHWNAMDEASRDDIRGRLSLTWGPGGVLDYSGGRWVSDRSYSSGDYGLARERFVR